MPFKYPELHKEDTKRYQRNYYLRNREDRIKYSQNYRLIHSHKVSKRMKRYRKDNPKKLKFLDFRHHLNKVYGMTIEQFNKKLEEQNGVCFICGKLNPDGRRLFIDHNHKTKKNRGLLCNRCNCFVGWYEKYIIKIKGYFRKYR